MKTKILAITIISYISFSSCDLPTIISTKTNNTLLSDTAIWLSVGDPMSVYFDAQTDQIIFLTNFIELRTAISGLQPRQTIQHYNGTWLVTYDLKYHRVLGYNKIDPDRISSSLCYDLVENTIAYKKNNKIVLFNKNDQPIDSIMTNPDAQVLTSTNNYIVIRYKSEVLVYQIQNQLFKLLFKIIQSNVNTFIDFEVISIDTVQRSLLVKHSCLNSEIESLIPRTDLSTGNCNQLSLITQGGIEKLEYGYNNYLISACATNRNGEAIIFYSPGVDIYFEGKIQKWNIKIPEYSWFNQICNIRKDYFIGLKNELLYTMQPNHGVRTDTLFVRK